MSLASALLALAVAAARASEIRHWPPPRSAAEAEDAVRRLAEAEGRHERALARLDALLAEHRALARGPREGDPAALLARLRGLESAYWPLIEEAGTLCDEEWMYIEAVNLATVGRALGAARGGQVAELSTAITLLPGLQARRAGLCQRKNPLVAAMREEEKEDAVLERRAAAAARRRRIAPWALGGAVALAAGLAWRSRRRALPAPPSRVTAPSLLVAERFEVGQLLGHCGIGETYAARDRVLQRAVALQRVRVELLADAAALDRFVSRGLAVAALKHPNLLRIHSVERQEGQLFVVTEPFDGETLEAALSQAGRLGWDAALRVARGTGFALEAAHGAGVVHGDVRPANIILTSGGEPLLMNFGAPPELKRSQVWATRPQAWASLAYQAPELERNAASPSADVYALAVCVYQMLTGAVPFPGPDMRGQKFSLRLSPLSEAAPGLRSRADRALSRALQPEPAQRFPSAGEFVRALETA